MSGRFVHPPDRHVLRAPGVAGSVVAAVLLPVVATLLLTAPLVAQELRTLAAETTLRLSPEPGAASLAVIAPGAALEMVAESPAGWLEVRVPVGMGDPGDPSGTAFVSTSEVEWVAECRPARPASPAPGETFRDCPFAPAMVVVPAGRFTMGTPESETFHRPNEGPQREVTIAAPFAIGMHEVTWDEWDACTRAGRCPAVDDERFGRGTHPVVNISWPIAQSYLEWLSEMTGHRYRLPSEAEWEYAARAGASAARYWEGGARRVCEMANVRDEALSAASSNPGAPVSCNDGHRTTAPVGSYPPNAFGVFDMLGNVMEWTQDCYLNTYAAAPLDGTAHEREPCPMRVLRGGSFGRGLHVARLGVRDPAPPTAELSSYGFRAVTDLSSSGVASGAAAANPPPGEAYADRSTDHELRHGVEPLVGADQAPWQVRMLAADGSVRRAPHPDSATVATLSRGTPLELVRELRSWIEVALTGRSEVPSALGYVARSDVEWVIDECDSSDSERTPRPGDVLQDCAFAPRVVVVPAGRFAMGSAADDPMRLPDDLPLREAVVEAPFAIGVYEVTQLEWMTCVRAGACRALDDDGWRGPELPVSNIGWDSAHEYLAWISRATGRSYRLRPRPSGSMRAGQARGRPGTGGTIRRSSANTRTSCPRAPSPPPPASASGSSRRLPAQTDLRCSHRSGRSSRTPSVSTTPWATSAKSSGTATATRRPARRPPPKRGRHRIPAPCICCAAATGSADCRGPAALAASGWTTALATSQVGFRVVRELR